MHPRRQAVDNTINSGREEVSTITHPPAPVNAGPWKCLPLPSAPVCCWFHAGWSPTQYMQPDVLLAGGLIRTRSS